MIELINLALAIIGTTLTIIFGGLYTSYWDILWGALILIGYWVGLLIIELAILCLTGIKPRNLPEFKEKPNKFFQVFMVLYMNVGRRLCNVRLKKVNMDLLPKNEKFVFVANHRSDMDPVISVSALGHNYTAYVSKKEIWKAPVLSMWMYNNGYMFMDRDDPRQSIRVIRRACEIIDKQLADVGIFPEGTRNKDENSPLGEFKPGALKIVERTKAPLVIACMTNTDVVKKRWPRRTTCYFKVIKVMYYDDYKDMNTQELAKYCEDLIRAEYIELKKLTK